MSATSEPEPAWRFIFPCRCRRCRFSFRQDVANGSSLARPEQAKVHDPLLAKSLVQRNGFSGVIQLSPLGWKKNNAKSMVTLSGICPSEYLLGLVSYNRRGSTQDTNWFHQVSSSFRRILAQLGRERCSQRFVFLFIQSGSGGSRLR